MAVHGVRGEDVPYIASTLAARGASVVGITGEDLLDEWLQAGNALDPRLALRSVAWADPAARYGAPALCLISKPGESLGDDIRIACCSKYRAAAGRYIAALQAGGRTVTPLWVSGSVETLCLSGLAEFLIDVVVTGATLERSGLVVRDVIRTSGIAVLESF